MKVKMILASVIFLLVSGFAVTTQAQSCFFSNETVAGYVYQRTIDEFGQAQYTPLDWAYIRVRGVYDPVGEDYEGTTQADGHFLIQGLQRCGEYTVEVDTRFSIIHNYATVEPGSYQFNTADVNKFYNFNFIVTLY